MSRGAYIVTIMTLDQLRVLDAILREGSFAGAARELHRATSAVSYAVRTLEESLGLDIFDRSQRKAVLTPEGELVLREARRVLDRARDLLALAGSLREEWEARFAVVLDGVLPIEPVIRAVSRFKQLDIPTGLEVAVEYLGGVTQVFYEGNVDAMVAIDLEPDPALVIQSLPPVEMVLLAHAEHPVARVKGFLSLDDFAGHVELVVSDSSRARPVSSLLRIGSPNAFRLPTFAAKTEAMLAGLGFGWLPLDLAQPHIDAGSLVPLRYEGGTRTELQPQLAWRRASPPLRAGQRFLDFLREELGAPSLAEDEAE